MTTTYGATRTYGCTTYSVGGMRSREDATQNILQRAFANGDWRPRTLRKKWWQIWLPREHNSEEKLFIERNPDAEPDQ